MSVLKHPICFRHSFQCRLFLVFSSIAALISILLCALFFTREITQHRAQTTEQLQMLSRHLADSIRLPLYGENREMLQQLAQETARTPGIRSVVITALDGRVLAVVGSKGADGNSKIITQIAEVRSMPMEASLDMGLADNSGNAAGALLGFVYLERGTADLDAAIARIIAVSCLISFFSWLLITGLCHLVLRKVTHSFNALAEGVQLMQSGAFETRINVTGKDEPARMAAAVNGLAESLQQREAENRRLNQQLLDVLSTLKENEAKLKNIMDRLPVAVAWSDQDESIEYINHFFIDRFGYDHADLPTVTDWLQRAYPEPEYRRQITAKRCAARDAALRGDTENSSYEATLTCKDGTTRRVIVSHQVTNRQCIAITVDVTERDLLQEQSIRIQKLESLGVLAGGIAHNFNNVLTGVMGYISFARRFIEEGHKSHKHLQSAEEATQRAAGIAKQLLTFARGGAPVRKPVSLRPLLESALALAAAGSCVEPTVDLSPDLHAVLADEGQLNQAFYCLILNAVQAMPNGGTLTVRGSNVSLDKGKAGGLMPGDFVELSFEDSGCGISEENRRQIFVPYFTTRAEIGKGMGLATVHSIVTRHGGAINFHSEVEQGTTFTIHLPSADSWPAV